MRTLNDIEIHTVSGGGVGAAIIAAPVILATGVALGGLALTISPVVIGKSYFASDNILHSLHEGFNYLSLVPGAMASALETLYFW